MNRDSGSGGSIQLPIAIPILLASTEPSPGLIYAWNTLRTTKMLCPQHWLQEKAAPGQHCCGKGGTLEPNCIFCETQARIGTATEMEAVSMPVQRLLRSHSIEEAGTNVPRIWPSGCVVAKANLEAHRIKRARQSIFHWLSPSLCSQRLLNPIRQRPSSDVLC